MNNLFLLAQISGRLRGLSDGLELTKSYEDACKLVGNDLAKCAENIDIVIENLRKEDKIAKAG